MNALFYDYEQVLIGNRDELSQFNFYNAKAGGLNEKKALSCIQYALENILQWDIEVAKRKFDLYIMRLMKMDRLIEYIEFPQEVEFGDGIYILSLLYPDKIKLDQKSMIENVYQRVLDGKGQFPREYFIGQRGFYRFCVCLCYLIANYKPFHNIEDIYEFFSSFEGKNFLDEYRLKVPMEHLNIDILQCIYTLTDEDSCSKFYYNYYEFIKEIKSLYESEETSAEEEK